MIINKKQQSFVGFKKKITKQPRTGVVIFTKQYFSLSLSQEIF